MKYVESAWIMLRPGGMKANSATWAGQARFGISFCSLHAENGSMHHWILPFLLQRSSRNALAGRDSASPKKTTKPKTPDVAIDLNRMLRIIVHRGHSRPEIRRLACRFSGAPRGCKSEGTVELQFLQGCN